ncbi:SWI/SNF chromatin-remodeling complex subunit snf22 [Balamuthia mandrillaris]
MLKDMALERSEATYLQRILAFLLDHTKYLQALDEIVPPDDYDEFSACLLTYAGRRKSRLHKLLWEAMEVEFKRHQADPTRILRGSSLASKLITRYTKRYGMGYLSQVLRKLIVKVVEDKDLNLELNSASVSDPEKLSKNQQHLRAIAEEFLDAFTNPTIVEQMPNEIRLLVRYISELARKYTPTHLHSLVGGFIMLRYINPGIINPESHSPTIALTSAKARRNLTLIAKVLQGLSNNLLFQDDFLKDHINAFIVEKHPIIQHFFDKICSNSFHNHDQDPLLDVKSRPTSLTKRRRPLSSDWTSVSLRSSMEHLHLATTAPLLGVKEPQQETEPTLQLSDFVLIRSILLCSRDSLLASMPYDDDFKDDNMRATFESLLRNYPADGGQHIFYFSPLEPNSRAVWLFMKTNNIPFIPKRMELLKHETKDPFFLEINPLGTLPVLVDISRPGHEAVLCDCASIFQHLFEKYMLPAHWSPIDPLSSNSPVIVGPTHPDENDHQPKDSLNPLRLSSSSCYPASSVTPASKSSSSSLPSFSSSMLERMSRWSDSNLLKFNRVFLLDPLMGNASNDHTTNHNNGGDDTNFSQNLRTQLMNLLSNSEQQMKEFARSVAFLEQELLFPSYFSSPSVLKDKKNKKKKGKRKKKGKGHEKDGKAEHEQEVAPREHEEPEEQQTRRLERRRGKGKHHNDSFPSSFFVGPSTGRQLGVARALDDSSIMTRLRKPLLFDDTPSAFSSSANHVSTKRGGKKQKKPRKKRELHYIGGGEDVSICDLLLACQLSIAKLFKFELSASSPPSFPRVGRWLDKVKMRVGESCWEEAHSEFNGFVEYLTVMSYTDGTSPAIEHSVFFHYPPAQLYHYILCGEFPFYSYSSSSSASSLLDDVSLSEYFGEDDTSMTLPSPSSARAEETQSSLSPWVSGSSSSAETACSPSTSPGKTSQNSDGACVSGMMSTSGTTTTSKRPLWKLSGGKGKKEEMTLSASSPVLPSAVSSFSPAWPSSPSSSCSNSPAPSASSSPAVLSRRLHPSSSSSSTSFTASSSNVIEEEGEKDAKLEKVVSKVVGGNFVYEHPPRMGLHLLLVEGTRIIQQSRQRDWPLNHNSIVMFEMRESPEQKGKTELSFRQLNVPASKLKACEQGWCDYWKMLKGIRTVELVQTLFTKQLPAEVHALFVDQTTLTLMTKTRCRFVNFVAGQDSSSSSSSSTSSPSTIQQSNHRNTHTFNHSTTTMATEERPIKSPRRTMFRTNTNHDLNLRHDKGNRELSSSHKRHHRSRSDSSNVATILVHPSKEVAASSSASSSPIIGGVSRATSNTEQTGGSGKKPKTRSPFGRHNKRREDSSPTYSFSSSSSSSASSSTTSLSSTSISFGSSTPPLKTKNRSASDAETPRSEEEGKSLSSEGSSSVSAASTPAISKNEAVQVGSEFMLFDGMVSGEVLELVAGKKIVFKWRINSSSQQQVLSSSSSSSSDRGGSSSSFVKSLHAFHYPSAPAYSSASPPSMFYERENCFPTKASSAPDVLPSSTSTSYQHHHFLPTLGAAREKRDHPTTLPLSSNHNANPSSPRERVRSQHKAVLAQLQQQYPLKRLIAAGVSSPSSTPSTSNHSRRHAVTLGTGSASPIGGIDPQVMNIPMTRTTTVTGSAAASIAASVLAPCRHTHRHFSTVEYYFKEVLYGTRIEYRQRNIPADEEKKVVKLQKTLWKRLGCLLTDDIYQSIIFQDEPSVVYSRLIDSDELSRLTETKCWNSKQLEGAYYLLNKTIFGQNVLLHPYNKIVQTYCGKDWKKDHSSTVTMTLREYFDDYDFKLESSTTGALTPLNATENREPSSDSSSSAFFVATSVPLSAASSAPSSAAHHIGGLKRKDVRHVIGRRDKNSKGKDQHKDKREKDKEKDSDSTTEDETEPANEQPTSARAASKKKTKVFLDHENVPEDKVQKVTKSWSNDFWEKIGGIPTESLVHVISFGNIAAHQVYDMLLNSERISKATKSKCEIQPAILGRYNLYGNALLGIIRKLEKNHLIGMELRACDWPPDHVSKVTFELQEEGSNNNNRDSAKRTILTFSQVEIPSVCMKSTEALWSKFWAKLKKHFSGEEDKGSKRGGIGADKDGSSRGEASNSSGATGGRRRRISFTNAKPWFFNHALHQQSSSSAKRINRHY